MPRVDNQKIKLMFMLELRDYALGVLENLIDTKDKQATDRKLTAYGYKYSSTGTGKKRVYTITALPASNSFRIKPSNTDCVISSAYLTPVFP